MNENNNYKFDPMTGQTIQSVNDQQPVQSSVEQQTVQSANVQSAQPVINQQSVQPITEQQPVQPQVGQPQDDNSKKKKINIKLIIIIVIAVVAVVLGIIFVPKLFSKKEVKNVSETIKSSNSFWIENKEYMHALFDMNGKQLTEFNFVYVGDYFINGTTYGENKNDEYGIISESGKMVIDFGKYSYIKQITGLYEVTDEKYDKYLIDSKGKILYNLEDCEIITFNSDFAFFLKSDDAYRVINYDGKEILNFPIVEDAEDPAVDEYKEYIIISYNNKHYIINAYLEKVLNTFESSEIYCINEVSQNDVILFNNCTRAGWDIKPRVYKALKDNKVNDLPKECERIDFDEQGNLICKIDYDSFLITDGFKKGFKDNHKAYIDNKHYAAERVNYNDVTLGVDFYQNENKVKSLNCRDLVAINGMNDGLYILKTTNTLDDCEKEPDDEYEYYNSKGEKMFGRSFKDASSFDKNNLAIVIEKDSSGYSLINNKGKKVSNVYEEMELSSYNNYYEVENNELVGVVNEKGKEIIPCKYSTVNIRYDKWATAETSDSKTVIYDILNSKEILTLDDSDGDISLYENYFVVNSGDEIKHYSYLNGKMFYQK